MKKYFYSKGQEKEGPVTIEDLKQVGIKPKTLIWHEGLDDWKEAEAIPELKEIFELIPPPLYHESHTAEGYQSKAFDFQNQMGSPNSFLEKKQRMFSNPFSFDGRIRRMEFGISFIIVFVVNTYLSGIVESGESSLIVFAYIPTLWFLWAQGAKRCHDIGNNGWWQIIPFYVFWLIFAPGDDFTNKYGVNPKS